MKNGNTGKKEQRRGRPRWLGLAIVALLVIVVFVIVAQRGKASAKAVQIIFN